jgi:hypothetical protein
VTNGRLAVGEGGAYRRPKLRHDVRRFGVHVSSRVTHMNELATQVFNLRTLSRQDRDSATRFYLTMSVISAALIFLGFAPSFYLKSLIHAPPPLTRLSITHGVVFTAWTGLFLTQSALIAFRKRLRIASSASWAYCCSEPW